MDWTPNTSVLISPQWKALRSPSSAVLTSTCLGCSAMHGLNEAAPSPQYILGAFAVWDTSQYGSSGGISLCDELNIWIKIDQIGTKS